MDPLVDIDVRLIFAILNGKVSTAISHKLARDFQKANLELKPEQWNVLQRLTYHDGVSQQELCEVMFKDRPGMVRLVNSMVEAGLVTRTLNRFDRRKNIIRITEKGKRMQEASIRIALQTLRGALRGLSLNDIRAYESFREYHGKSRHQATHGFQDSIRLTMPALEKVADCKY